jgi:hypothetical protein
MFDEVPQSICKNCLGPITPNASRKNKIYCSHNCGVVWRTKNVYKHKYSVVHRGRSAETFMRSLCVKKSERRHLTQDILIDLYKEQNGLCALSGVEMTYLCGVGKVDTNISLDKIDPQKGYVVGNLQLVCHRVNIMKFDKSKDDLLGWCKKIAEQ